MPESSTTTIIISFLMASCSRRDLLKTACVLPVLSGSLRAARDVSLGITDIQLDLNRLHKWDSSNGDTWDPFWADDDTLYAFNCDGRGFGTSPRNLAFNCLVGESVDALTGSMVNTMDEYGRANEKKSDNATWKACGQECIDSVFYAFVSRNTYGNESGDNWLRQTAVNSSLIKSTNRGLTWTRSAADNYSRPMWPGAAFGAPFFIHYGKNGGNVAQDGADRYVYAVSTNGFWNDGDSYTLARVPRPKLRDLNAGDWLYFTGADGNAATVWSPRFEDAKPLLHLPLHCSQSGPCYIHSLGLYLMVVWYNTQKLGKWYEPTEMRYDFYQAPHPWGPWSAIRSFSDRFLAPGQHMYGPSLCAKFQRADGTDVHMTMFTSGCPFQDIPGGVYKAWSVPVIVRTTPVSPSTRIPYSDPRIFFKGSWSLSSQDRLLGSVRQSTSVGDSAELSFSGIGVDYIADKQAGFGAFDIYLDGKLVHTGSLATENLPKLSGVTVFSSGKLVQGDHTIRVVNKTAVPIVLGSFVIYD